MLHYVVERLLRLGFQFDAIGIPYVLDLVLPLSLSSRLGRSVLDASTA